MGDLEPMKPQDEEHFYSSRQRSEEGMRNTKVDHHAQSISEQIKLI